MARYRKFLYNDDCILDTKYNVVLYENDKGWEKYEKWKSKYSDLENEIQKEKEALLKWNGGKPTKVNGITRYYHKNWKIYKYESDDVKLEYNIDGVLIKKIDEKSEVHYSAELPDKIYESYKKNNLVIEEYFDKEYIYKSSLQRNNIKVVRKKLPNRKTSEKKTYVDDVLVKHTTYYTNTNSVYSEIYNDYYTEYFTNKKLRAEGYLVDDKPDGHWKFYHINGELESEHWFIKGKFKPKSRSSVYFENTELNFNIKHG